MVSRGGFVLPVASTRGARPLRARGKASHPLVTRGRAAKPPHPPPLSPPPLPREIARPAPVLFRRDAPGPQRRPNHVRRDPRVAPGAVLGASAQLPGAGG